MYFPWYICHERCGFVRGYVSLPENTFFGFPSAFHYLQQAWIPNSSEPSTQDTIMNFFLLLCDVLCDRRVRWWVRWSLAVFLLGCLARPRLDLLCIFFWFIFHFPTWNTTWINFPLSGFWTCFILKKLPIRNLHGDPDHGEAFSIGFFWRQRRRRHFCTPKLRWSAKKRQDETRISNATLRAVSYKLFICTLIWDIFPSGTIR